MLQDVFERSLSGDITKEDAMGLLQVSPFQLFETADALRKEIVGDEVSFVVNRNIDITDRCIIGCAFCSFRNNIGYQMTTEQIVQSVKEAKDVGASEVCMLSGIMPHMNVDYYSDVFMAIKAEHDIMIHGLSPMELFHAAKMSGIPTKEAIAKLKDAGMDTMTGAAAEILVDSVRAKICPKKIPTAEWVRIIKEAHGLGVKSTSTIMYGTVETWEDRVDHMLILRDIQRETGGFTEFIPLTFMYQNNRLSGESRGCTGMDDLRLHALARVIFGRDMPNIQASWIKMGVKLSQVALCCGANDLGGTMMEDKITIAAGSTHGEHLPREDMNAAIRAIGRVPRERDTLYRAIKS